VSESPGDSQPQQAQQQPLSKRQMLGLFRAVQNGEVTDEQVQSVLNQIPEETKRQAIETAIEDYIVPHFDDVRERAAADVTNEQVRQKYAALGEERQQEVFNRAVSDVLGTLFELRTQPESGLESLKGLLRDPYTIEGLLLIFDNDQHIDAEYSAQMKDFAAMHLKWAGVALAPEMYDPAVVEAVAEEIGLDVHEPADR
jgi:hypothetical protein